MNIYPFNITTKIWFRIGMLQCEQGIIKKWIYDTWFEVYDLDDKKLYWVLPGDILIPI